jgi:MinD superfamily P-loop ATPase
LKQLTVISGKGGTGKTTLVASLAHLAGRSVLVDADVDAADLHLLLKPRIQRRDAFVAAKVAGIDPALCNQCGRCQEVCRFEAIRDFNVDPIACEGCGVCLYVCPKEAVRLKDVQSGEWFVSDTRYGPMVHAKLGVAQDNSGKLVTLVRKEGQRIAKEGNYPLILIDGPPGIGCPVIASVGGVDAALLVTEPSVSGLHDLERVLAVCRHFQVPAWVCVNKWDISPEYTEKIEVFVKDAGSGVIGKLPFDPAVTRAMVAEKTVLEYSSGAISKEIGNLWSRLHSFLNESASVEPPASQERSGTGSGTNM